MDQNNLYYDMNSYENRTNKGNKEGKSGAFLSGMIVGMICALLIVSAILLISVMTGKVKQNSNKTFDNLNATGESETGEQVSEKSGKFVNDRIISKLDGLVEIIRETYFLDEVSDEELEEGLYKGLFNALGDPYSEYYTPEEFAESMNESEGIYYGIGAYVSMDSEYKIPKIAGVFKDSPAERAGLRTDDLIYMVNGELTTGKTLSEVVRNHLRGEENTEVVLTIVRDGEKLEKTVIRGKVESPTVDSEMLDGGMGYVRIAEFDTVTTKQYLEAMDELYAQGMKGLILDLRANPGGNVITAVEIAQNILPKGIVVYTEDKNKQRTNYRCKGDKELKIPMVVLVDVNTASSAEILAGAIQDYGKGTLVGTKTYGKGIVQSVLRLRDDSGLKITMSGYFTPNGRNIHKIGIEPDIVCEFDGTLYYDTENPIDTQLEKAKEVLKEKMK